MLRKVKSIWIFFLLLKSKIIHRGEEEFMRENFYIALAAVTGSRTRSILTILIIAIGITSIVGIQSAIDNLADEVTGSFGKMGAGTFSLRGEAGAPLSRPQALTIKQAIEAQTISIHSTVQTSTVVSSRAGKSDPVMNIIAADENYIICKGLEIASGRNFTPADAVRGRPLCIIGDNIRKKVLKDGCDGGVVSAAGAKFEVVGILKRQGAVFGTGADNSLIIPLSYAAAHLASGTPDISLEIIPPLGSERKKWIKETETIVRRVRRVPAGVKNDFVIEGNDSSHNMLYEIRAKLSAAALLIGLITMLGAAVGLMNIMLVCVKERTMEIGLRKALGAAQPIIRRQFLLEAVIIGQTGALAGSLLGLLFGRGVAALMECGWTVPWKWMVISALLCLAVSLTSGYIPARRAAALDPIEALRCSR